MADKSRFELSMTTHGNSADPIVEFRKVSKSFGRLVVLRDIDLQLERGQTTVIIGESGTGKSVLLKHMMGLLRPDSGEVWVAGKRVDQLKERAWVDVRKRFGFLFQMGALFDSMSAGENIAFPLREHTRLSEKEIQEKVAQKLGLVGLDGSQNKRPAELSGGQRKRVALARAIAMEPEIILYDEPTTGLDPLRADTINDLIIKLKRELNITSVVVTHDMTSAYKVADRILMLQKGRFIADATPDDIRHTEDPRVRRFVTGNASAPEPDASTVETAHE